MKFKNTLFFFEKKILYIFIFKFFSKLSMKAFITRLFNINLFIFNFYETNLLIHVFNAECQLSCRLSRWLICSFDS